MGEQAAHGSFSSRFFWVSSLLVSLIGAVFQLINLRPSLIDLFAFRQTHTAIAIKEFMDGNWSLATPFTTLGPPWQMAYEFPLFQAVAAIVGNVFELNVDTAARMTGLGFFLISGLLLAILIRRWFGTTAALITLILFQFMPFGIQWASSSLIEFTAVSCVLGAVLAIERNSRKFSWSMFSLATLLLSLASAVKGTTTVAWALVFLVAGSGLVWHKRLQLRAVLTALISTLLGLGFGLIWTAYADNTKMENPVAKNLTSEQLFQWTYGTLEQRLTFEQWDQIFERLPSLGASLWIFIVLLVIALWRLKLNARLVALASVPFIGTLIFFNLYVVHSYYLSAIYPAYVAVVAIGVTALSRLIHHRQISLIVASALSALLVFLSWTSIEGRAITALIGVGGQFPEISRVIAESTPPDAGVIVVGCDWDPTPLYYADRKGMTVPPWFDEKVPTAWVGNELNYLIFCGENYSVANGDPSTVLPTGSLYKVVSPGIYQVFGPDVVTRILNWSVVP